MRDYFQIPGISWLLVGDTELKRFIAQEVDRVDDIIDDEVEIKALSKQIYFDLINKRINYFKKSPTAAVPVDKEVWIYLYYITRGRLRYIFGLINRLCTNLRLGSLTSCISLKMAIPELRSIGEQRIKKFRLSSTELVVLQTIVKHYRISVKEIAQETKKSQNQISNILSSLFKQNLVAFHQEWRTRYYFPSVDARLAYSDETVESLEKLGIDKNQLIDINK